MTYRSVRNMLFSVYLVNPKVSMTTLCSTAAPDCGTNQSKGRYRKQERSILVVVLAQNKTW